MSYPMPFQGQTFTCSLCNQSRTAFWRWQSDTNLFVCTTCQPLVAGGSVVVGGGNPGSGPAGPAVDAFPINGSGATQHGTGGGVTLGANQWNANPSMASVAVFAPPLGSSSSPGIQTQDGYQHVKDLLSY